jgi:hypothetical protein
VEQNHLMQWRCEEHGGLLNYTGHAPTVIQAA